MEFDCFPVGTGQHCHRAQGVRLGLRAPCCECRLELGGHGGDHWGRLQKPRVCLESQAQPRLFLESHLLVTRWLRHWEAFIFQHTEGLCLHSWASGPGGHPRCDLGAGQKLCRQTCCWDLSLVYLRIQEHKQGPVCWLGLPLRVESGCSVRTFGAWTWCAHTPTYPLPSSIIQPLPQMMGCLYYSILYIIDVREHYIFC